MRTISINAIAAANEAATTIEGLGEDFLLVADNGETVDPVGFVRRDRDYTELRTAGDGPRSSSVTIERPSFRYGGTLVPATVTWSSSDSRGGIGEARVTARLMAFAAAVAEQLNTWADAGQLPRLSAEGSVA